MFLSLYILIVGGLVAGAASTFGGSGAEFISATVGILTILFSLLGILMITGAIGLWQLVEWGRQVTIWTRAVELFFGFASLGIGSTELAQKAGLSGSLVISGMFGIVVSIFIISYLVREEIKVLFQQEEILPERRQLPEQQRTFEHERISPPSPQVSQPFPPSAPPAAPMPAQPQAMPANLMVWLEIVQGANVGQRFFILKPNSLVGRSNESDIQILEPSVSRRHFRLRFENGQFLLENESAQGTYVNGQPVMGWQPLKDGDYIQAGRVIFQFRIGGQVRKG